MIIVKVELHSALTGRKTPLAAMVIANDGTGTQNVGNYIASRLKKGTVEPHVSGPVKGHRRLDESVWNLVAKAIAATTRSKPVPVAQPDLFDVAQETAGTVEDEVSR